MDALEHGDLSLEEAMGAFRKGCNKSASATRRWMKWKSGWNSCSRIRLWFFIWLFLKALWGDT